MSAPMIAAANLFSPFGEIASARPRLDSWRIDASGCYRLDVFLRERDPPLTAEQHEQDLDSLVRFHIGEDRAGSLEWTAQNSYVIATPGPVPRQFDRPITFTSADLADHAIGHPGGRQAVHDQAQRAGTPACCVPLQLDPDKAIARKQG